MQDNWKCLHHIKEI
uniref:Uncharacterized protein n=1 Tax=Anguilla anguilla TaxID=7936 RepID=A0A0E9W2E0_ANGAN